MVKQIPLAYLTRLLCQNKRMYGVSTMLLLPIPLTEMLYPMLTH